MSSSWLTTQLHIPVFADSFNFNAKSTVFDNNYDGSYKYYKISMQHDGSDNFVITKRNYISVVLILKKHHYKPINSSIVLKKISTGKLSP